MTHYLLYEIIYSTTENSITRCFRNYFLWFTYHYIQPQTKILPLITSFIYFEGMGQHSHISKCYPTLKLSFVKDIFWKISKMIHFVAKYHKNVFNPFGYNRRKFPKFWNLQRIFSSKQENNSLSFKLSYWNGLETFLGCFYTSSK